jgi:hypothetical protein
MKIGFTGAGGTGKTTVLKLLEGMDLALPVFPSVVRGVYQKWGLKETDQANMLPTDRWKLQRDIIMTRFEEEEKRTSFISDRTLVDHLAFCLVRNWDVMPMEEYEALIYRAKPILKRYDLIFFFPFVDNFNPPDDGFRQQERTYHFLMDLTMFGLIQKLGLIYAKVPFMEPEYRAQWVKRAIDKHC